MEWIDSLRGLCVILVVFGHAANGLMASGIDAHKALLDQIYGVMFSFRMPLLFLLSGLLLQMKCRKEATSKILYDKIRYILYPFVVWSLFYLVLYSVFGAYSSSGTKAYSVSTFMVQPISHLWFLQTLFLVTVLAVCVRRLNFIAKLAACLMMLVVQAVVPCPLVIDNVLIYSVYFLIGSLFVDRPASYALARSNRAFLVVAAPLAYAVAVAFYGPSLNWNGAIKFPVSMLMCLALIAVSDHIPKTAKAGLAHVGRASLYIFILHPVFVAATRMVLARLFDVQSTGVHLLAEVVVSVAGCLVAYHICRVTPLRYAFAMPDVAAFIRSRRKASSVAPVMAQQKMTLNMRFDRIGF
jgi:fucose 4-O-acetylase-like acetyltransferase